MRLRGWRQHGWSEEGALRLRGRRQHGWSEEGALRLRGWRQHGWSQEGRCVCEGGGAQGAAKQCAPGRRGLASCRRCPVCERERAAPASRKGRHVTSTAQRACRGSEATHWQRPQGKRVRTCVVRTFIALGRGQGAHLKGDACAEDVVGLRELHRQGRAVRLPASPSNWPHAAEHTDVALKLLHVQGTCTCLHVVIGPGQQAMLALPLSTCACGACACTCLLVVLGLQLWKTHMLHKRSPVYVRG